MTETEFPRRSRPESLPEFPACAGCGAPLAEPYGWCSGCRAAHCLACGRRHFCSPSCPANGCLPGLCVRLVRNGVLSETWGLPDEEGERADEGE